LTCSRMLGYRSRTAVSSGSAIARTVLYGQARPRPRTAGGSDAVGVPADRRVVSRRQE
jgi:hypothetical protein